MAKIEMMIGLMIFLSFLILGTILFFYQFMSCTSDNPFLYCTLFWKFYW